MGALLEFATECRLSQAQAREVIGRVVAEVGQWRGVASMNGITHGELALFADAIDTQVASLSDLVD